MGTPSCRRRWIILFGGLLRSPPWSVVSGPCHRRWRASSFRIQPGAAEPCRRSLRAPNRRRRAAMAWATLRIPGSETIPRRRCLGAGQPHTCLHFARPQPLFSMISNHFSAAAAHFPKELHPPAPPRGRGLQIEGGRKLGDCLSPGPKPKTRHPSTTFQLLRREPGQPPDHSPCRRSRTGKPAFRGRFCSCGVPGDFVTL